jgi:hypothetical protein
MGARRRTLAARELVASLSAIAAAVALGACGPGDGAEPGAPPDGAAPQDGAAPAPPPQAVPDPEPSPPPARPPVRVSFKLDPALTSGVYMGERWVAPPVFQAAAQTGGTFRQEARVEVGGSGAFATWTPSEPDSVSVSATAGPQVEIAVFRPGRSALTVSLGGESTTLTIDAVHRDGRWLVTFSE